MASRTGPFCHNAASMGSGGIEVVAERLSPHARRGAGAGDGGVGGAVCLCRLCWRGACCRCAGRGLRLAQAIASRLLCAAALADRCGDEPVLIAAYGTEVGELVRRHMPSLLFERGSRAVPVDFRRCRETECGDAAEHGYVQRTDAGLPVSAFVHVIDCRPDAAEESEAGGVDCSGVASGQSLPAVLDLLRGLGDVPWNPDRSASRDFTRTTGRGSRSASAPTARSTSGPHRTRATTSGPGPSAAGLRMPASIPSRARPKRSACGPEWLGPGDPPADRLRRQPRRQHRRDPPHRTTHPAQPRPPDPARADRRRHRRPLRDQPALAKESLARPRGRRHRLSDERNISHVGHGKCSSRSTSAASATRRRTGSSRR